MSAAIKEPLKAPTVHNISRQGVNKVNKGKKEGQHALMERGIESNTNKEGQNNITSLNAEGLAMMEGEADRKERRKSGKDSEEVEIPDPPRGTDVSARDQISSDMETNTNEESERSKKWTRYASPDSGFKKAIGTNL